MSELGAAPVTGGQGPPTVLIAEDDEVISGVLVDYLRQAGFETHQLSRGDAVEPWLADHPTDVLLLDIMLPGKSGMDICRALTAATMDGRPRPAILMVTARVEEIDRLLGLELGADDYICKPFSPREVVARVKAVLRRQSQPVGTGLAGGAVGSPVVPGQGLVLDLPSARAWLDGQDLGLTAVELQLLAHLAAQPGRIYSRDQLMDAMYRDQRVVADRTVDSHVKKLRRKLEEVRPGAELIASVYGLGYKLVLPMTPAS